MGSMTEGEVAILSRLADVAQQNAVTGERLVGVLEKLDSHLVRMDSDREQSVAAIKNHVTETAERGRADYRKLFLFCAGLLAVAEVLRVGLEKALTLLGH